MKKRISAIINNVDQSDILNLRVYENFKLPGAVTFYDSYQHLNTHVGCRYLCFDIRDLRVATRFINVL